MTNLMFCICLLGVGLNKMYFPIMIPPGVIGNILSFLVLLFFKHLCVVLFISIFLISKALVTRM